jgi:hypothetical protein
LLPVVTTIEPNLLEIAIRMTPRARLCRFSSVMPSSVPSNISPSADEEALDRLLDRHRVIAAAERPGAGLGVGE